MIHPYGFLSPDDEKFLIKIGSDLPKTAQILEIGTFLGCSASFIGDNTKAKLDTVEILVGNYRLAKKNLSSLKNVTVHRKSSRTFKWNKPLDVLWIDGDHSNKGVENDIKRFSKFIKKGGIICGHDYTGSDCTVYEVVDKLIKNNPDWEDFHIEAEHIWIARRK